MQIYEGDKLLYSYGAGNALDEKLRQSLAVLGGDATTTHEGRAMYVRYTGVSRIYFSGDFVSVRNYANMRAGIILAAALLALTICGAVYLTNRFLTRFVLRRIEEPLDILTDGVHKLKSGELGYRIRYDREDEFAPVCEDFNEMAEQLRLSMEKIKAQEQSRKELIAGISHDIRSPLTSIQAYVEGLIDGVANTPQKQQMYLQTIKKKAQDLSRMVSQLFLFSKMELGEYIEHPTLLWLDEVIRDTVEGIKGEYESEGLLITTQLEPVQLMADSVQLERIITNILGNSLKYKSRPCGHAKVSLVRTQDGCVLTFTDDGPGVEAEALPHLFEVFYRSDPARVNPDKGSGLGLAIVANAVAHMGGTVQASLAEGGGLKLTLWLPIETQKGEENGKAIDC